MSMLQVENIQKSFGKTEVLKNISFSLEKGDMLGIIGTMDARNEDVPYESPSNLSMQATGICLEDGTEVALTLEQANMLNSQGIVTALNFSGGWKSSPYFANCPVSASIAPTTPPSPSGTSSETSSGFSFIVLTNFIGISSRTGSQPAYDFIQNICREREENALIIC